MCRLSARSSRPSPAVTIRRVYIFLVAGVDLVGWHSVPGLQSSGEREALRDATAFKCTEGPSVAWVHSPPEPCPPIGGLTSIVKA